MNVAIPDLTNAECGDIAITAAEGGIGYWSQIVDEYDYERWSPDSGVGCEEVADDFVFYTLEWEGREPAEELIKVTPALIKRGFERALAAPLSEGGWMANGLLRVPREDWMGMIDSEGADMIIQFGAFSELVYG